MSNSFFKSQQTNKVNSPEQLNDYIKTSNPGAVLFCIEENKGVTLEYKIKL